METARTKAIREKLQDAEQAIQRWQPRMTRAANAVVKFSKRANYYHKLLADELAKTKATKPKAEPPKPKVEDVTNIPVTELPIADKTRTPSERKKAQEFGDKLEKAVRGELQQANDRLAKAWNASMPKGGLQAKGGTPSDHQVAVEVSKRKKRRDADDFRRDMKAKAEATKKAAE